MPARCVVAGCSNTNKDGVSLHKFPQNERLRRLWTSKVRLTRANWLGPFAFSLVCSDLFAEDDFEESFHAQFGMKRAQKLKESAIPSRIKTSTTSAATSSQGRRREASERREKNRVIMDISDTAGRTWPWRTAFIIVNPRYFIVLITALHFRLEHVR